MSSLQRSYCMMGHAKAIRLLHSCFLSYTDNLRISSAMAACIIYDIDEDDRGEDIQIFPKTDKVSGKQASVSNCYGVFRFPESLRSYTLLCHSSSSRLRAGHGSVQGEQDLGLTCKEKKNREQTQKTLVQIAVKKAKQ